MQNNVNNILNNTCLTNISWITLNKSGLIEEANGKFNNIALIYIYQFIKDNSIFYIGSTFNINKRINQHRFNVNNGKRSCPKFHNYIEQHGWDNFRLGILEYIDIYGLKDKEDEIKRVKLVREQYYLDILNPPLNSRRAVARKKKYKCK